MMYQPITKDKFISDMTERKMTNQAAEIMWNYMLKNYSVKNYDADAICNKFEVLTIDKIKEQFGHSYEHYCKYHEIDYASLSNREIFVMMEEITSWVLVERLDDKTCLFDKEWYATTWENY